VTNHGEVFTRKREVNVMLDLVKQETERIESRFLEPAYGTGNFLAEILERKLRVVEKRYRRIQLEYERNAVLAISSIYGIDILQDNVETCCNRLFNIFDQKYTTLFKTTAKEKCRKTVKYILQCNIIWGDALTLKTVSENPKLLVFSEWSLFNGSMLKCRDFTFRGLLKHEGMKELPLFSELGEDVFIPIQDKEYKSKRKQIQEKLIKFATRIPLSMYLTDYCEWTLRDVITQLEPCLFKKVTGLSVKDFELLVSLDVFNSVLMNDAVYKFKRYEDASLVYTGINKHKGEDIGLYDTVLSAAYYTPPFENVAGGG